MKTTGRFSSMNQWLLGFMKIIDWVDNLTGKILIATMGVMAALVCAQVFCRYVLGSSIDWADEMSRLMFVCSMFLAIPHGIRAGVHVGIDFFIKGLPERVRQNLARAMFGTSAVVALVVFFYGAVVAVQKWDELMPTVDITASVYYLPVLISMLHSFLHLIFLTVAGADVWEREGVA